MSPPPAAVKTAVTRLTLTDFRCYGSLRLDLDERPVVLTGPNGAGKTNLLEALSFLVPGRGLRRARLGEIGRRDPARPDAPDAPAVPWAVAATVAAEHGVVEIGTGLAAGSDSVAARRVVRIDGADARGQAELGEWVRAAWLTPEMDRLFTEGASERRRFLDRLVFGFDAAHARCLSDYERAMRERTRLLRDGRLGPAADPAWLVALEDRMARNGVAVAAARRGYVARLNAAGAMAIGPFPAADLAVDDEIGAWLADMPALGAEDRFRDRLVEFRARDADAGRATMGPHRADLACRHVARDTPARRCSTGEQKALLISIVLANVRLQALECDSVPMLLLDEIVAHLDLERREALFEEICASGAQAWMTGTDAAMFAPLGDRARHYRVSDATLTRTG